MMPTRLKTEGLSRLEPVIRAHSFFSARVAEAHVLDVMCSVSDRFGRDEIDLATAHAEVKRRLGTKRTPGTKADSSLTDVCSAARLNLALEQNARMAYAVGEYEQEMAEVSRLLFPAWRYMRSTSVSPREDHAQYAGKVWLKTDPVWRRIFPPSDFGCKCSVEEVSADEIDDGDAKVERLTREAALPDTAESGFAFDPAEAFNCNLAALSDTEVRKSVMGKILTKLESTDRPLRFRCLAAPPADGGPRPSTGKLTAADGDLADLVRDMGARATNTAHRNLGKSRFPEKLPIAEIGEDLLDSLGLPEYTERQIVLEGKNSAQGVRHMAQNHPDVLKSGEFTDTLVRLLTQQGLEASLSIEREQPWILHIREPGTENLLTLRQLPEGDWAVVSPTTFRLEFPLLSQIIT